MSLFTELLESGSFPIWDLNEKSKDKKERNLSTQDNSALTIVELYEVGRKSNILSEGKKTSREIN